MSTSVIGLARYSREYYESAIAADQAIGDRPGYEITAPPPVMFLVAHAIELAIKAYLVYVGCSEGQLRSVGHDLSNCWQAAVRNGVEELVRLDGEDLELLQLISELHTSTELRYIRTGYKTVPVFGPLQTMALKILDGICPYVGYM